MVMMAMSLRGFYARKVLTQRRTDAKRYRGWQGFLCVFAPLRENHSLAIMDKTELRRRIR
jgi:hypothetical protein